MLCDGCTQFVQSKNLSPHSILYCTSERPEHVQPPKPKFSQAMQEYFWGKITDDITPKTVCYGVYVSSWTGNQFPARCKVESEPRCSEAGFAETPATAYLTQWVMIGSNPLLVMYDRGSNINLICGKVAETQELQRISNQAGRIAVTGGGHVSAHFGSYKTQIRLANSGAKRELICQGIQEITGWLKKHTLQEIHQELRNIRLGFDAPLQEYTGGGQVSSLVGLQDISLDPVLIGILPSGLGVYQCPFVDIWGSSIAVVGPHPSFRAPQTQESGALFIVSRMEKPTRPGKSGYKKPRFRRRPCLCLSPAAGGGGNS